MALAPGTAGAASVSEASGSLSYAAATSETNDVKIEPWGLAIRITDAGLNSGKKAIALSVGTGCWKLSTSAAACAIPTNGIQFEGGDSADRLDASTLMATRVNAGGGDGDDVLLTGGGADSLSGGDGSDTLSSGAGDDSIQARDGATDRIVCSGGTDSGIADADDSIGADCESVLPPAPVVDPGPGSGSVDPDPADTDDPTDDPGDSSDDPGDSSENPGERAANAVPPTIPPQTVGVSAAGVATVKIVCPADSGGCSGTVVIDIPAPASGKTHGKGTLAKAAARRPAALRIGKAKFNAKAGTSPLVPVRLSKRGRQRIIRRRRSKARITVTTRSATGGSVVTTQEVTIRPKRSAARRRAHKARP
jgi:Ca2+-binding RTX toxin-like protein